MFKFDFASPTNGELKRYPIAMFKADGDMQSLFASLIYIKNTDSKLFYPVKGYMVGATNEMNTYNDKCAKSNFSYNIGSRGIFGASSLKHFVDFGFIDFIE